MKHAEFANPHGRHVTQCGRDVSRHTVVAFHQFVALAIYPDYHADLCVECCASIQRIMRAYRQERGDGFREEYDEETT